MNGCKKVAVWFSLSHSGFPEKSTNLKISGAVCMTGKLNFLKQNLGQRVQRKEKHVYCLHYRF